MADDPVRVQLTTHYLHGLDILGAVAGLGTVSTMLLEFEHAPVAVVRSRDGECLLKGSSPAEAGRILLEARKFDRRPSETMQPVAKRTHDADAYWDEWLEVAEAVLEPAGQVVTARVALVHGGRRVVATSTGRNAEERHLYLMAEAAARAVTEFLPHGYGVILGEIQPVPGELRALKASVLFMTPTEDRPLEGVASVADRPDTAAARTVLAAVHDHIKPLLSHAG